MTSVAFKRKSDQQIYRFEEGVWRGPDSRVIQLTRLQEKIFLRFLHSSRPAFSADQIQRNLAGEPSADDPTAYRKHISKVNKAFGFKLLSTHLNSGIRSGGARSRRADYRLADDIEVLPGTAAAESAVPFPIDAYREALRGRREWLTIRPFLASRTEVKVEELYVELFLRRPGHGALTPEASFGAVVEQEVERSAAAVHYVTAESLVARTAGRTVIVGPPGSGKTTLVKWICSYLLNRGEAGELTPFPVSLRDFAEEFHSDRASGLETYALNTVIGSTGLLPIEPAEGAKKGLPGICLLDGWDEVPIAMRARVLAEIDRVSVNGPVLITSRLNAAVSLIRDPQTSIFEVGPLADGAAAELCTRYGEARDRANLIPGLLQLIENSPSLWPLAGNPYLLTLFCEVVFAAAEFPEAAEVSPVWVLSRAIELIRSDYNGSNPLDPLPLGGLERIEQLAHVLSFDRKNKRTTFEPENYLGQSRNEFVESPTGRSRFFNATGIANTSFAFVHLRLQEYLAGRCAVREGEVAGPWLRRHLLSQVRREEARFAAALILSSGSPVPRGLISAVRALIQQPDQSGESIRCAASILAAAGVRDGGRHVLGIDVRPILWQRIDSEPLFLSEYAQSLLELDPVFFQRQLTGLSEPDNMLFGHLYRFVPLGLRREGLDPRLAVSPVLSWVIGLPGRGFPTRQSIDALGDVAVDERAVREDRIRALRDLGSFRSRSQVGRLTHLLASPDEELSCATAETLGKIGGREAAAALATELISIEESHALQSPGLISALLNALTVEGYGAIEPYSRDILVAHINTAPDSSPNLEITLDALAGTPLPHPPARILNILADRAPKRESLRKAAASNLLGIADTGFLNGALKLLSTEPSRQVRQHILRSLPFVPVNCPDTSQLWELCRSPSTSDASHALRLIFRTAARYPNHILAAPLSEFIGTALDRIAIGDCGPLDLQILHGLHTIRPGESIRSALLRILKNPAINPDVLTVAVEALALCTLSPRDLSGLSRKIASALRLGQDGAALAASLAVTVFSHRPEAAPALLRTLMQTSGTSGTVHRDALLRAAQRAGYLIFDDCVVGPDGHVRRARETSR